MNDMPTYSSKSTIKSLWQEYRIFNDRVEFHTLLGKMVVPFDHIEKVNISESEIKGLLRGDLHLKNFRPALKLDWANFLEHVVLDKSQGHIRRILFTPENPLAFKKALDNALTRYHERRHPE
jgi:hypothetical protein